MTLVLEIPGSLLTRYRKVWNSLGSDVDGSCWLQIDMFLETKVEIIVATRYVSLSAGMPKMHLQPGLSPRHLLESL